jgi:hypothetical protein
MTLNPVEAFRFIQKSVGEPIPKGVLLIDHILKSNLNSVNYIRRNNGGKSLYVKCRPNTDIVLTDYEIDDSDYDITDKIAIQLVNPRTVTIDKTFVATNLTLHIYIMNNRRNLELNINGDEWEYNDINGSNPDWLDIISSGNLLSSTNSQYRHYVLVDDPENLASVYVNLTRVYD